MIRYTEPDAFVAVIGGLFSLCLGGSILSLIELVTSTLKTFFYTFFTNDTEENNPYPPLYWGEILSHKNPEKIKNISYITHYDNYLN